MYVLMWPRCSQRQYSSPSSSRRDPTFTAPAPTLAPGVCPDRAGSATPPNFSIVVSTACTADISVIHSADRWGGFYPSGMAKMQRDIFSFFFSSRCADGGIHPSVIACVAFCFFHSVMWHPSVRDCPRGFFFCHSVTRTVVSIRPSCPACQFFSIPHCGRWRGFPDPLRPPRSARVGSPAR